MGEEGQKVSLSWSKINPRDVEKQNKVGMLIVFRGFPSGSAVKNPLAMQEMSETLGSVPESGRSPGGGDLLQYSCLRNPMDRTAWRATVHEIERVI